MDCKIVEQIKFCNKYLDRKSKEYFLKEVFSIHFINNETENDADDLLFFIYKIEDKKKVGKTPKIEVFRKMSPKLPLKLLTINWEETLYLNLILQNIEYNVLYSVITRTSDQHYQVLMKHKVRVYATPSYHSVVSKESTEQYSYPYINFNIEDFENFLYGFALNDMELIYIEVIAQDISADQSFVIFSASIDHLSINEAYLSKKLLFNSQYLGLVEVQDLYSEGNAKIVVKKKIKRSMSDGSSSNFSHVFKIDEERILTPEAFLSEPPPNHNRRLPKTSQAKYSSMNKHKNLTFKSIDILSDFNDESQNRIWKQNCFSQLYFDWKEKRKHACHSYHTFVASISVPWQRIIACLLSNEKRSAILL